jgi:hypothetical protein
MYIENQGRLSCYSSGRCNCIVLEIGDGVNQTMPINEGKYESFFLIQLNQVDRTYCTKFYQST